MNTEFMLRQLRSMANNKAVGLYGINIKLFKLSAPAVVSSLTNILCNFSLQTGIFATKWKEARVHYSIKVALKINVKTTGLSLCYLCCQKFLQDRFLFISTNISVTITSSKKVSMDSEKIVSCQTTLIDLTAKMYNARYTGQMLGAVELDLKKASDLVNHDLLVQKLKLYRCSSDSV